jgi:hypothetical protein
MFIEIIREFLSIFSDGIASYVASWWEPKYRVYLLSCSIKISPLGRVIQDTYPLSRNSFMI